MLKRTINYKTHCMGIYGVNISITQLYLFLRAWTFISNIVSWKGANVCPWKWTQISFLKKLKKILFVFLGPRPWHMEVPRLGFESEMQLLAYTTATAMPDPSCICNLHNSSWQCQILNLLSEARDQTRVLMDASQIRFHWATMGNLIVKF